MRIRYRVTGVLVQPTSAQRPSGFALVLSIEVLDDWNDSVMMETSISTLVITWIFYPNRNSFNTNTKVLFQFGQTVMIMSRSCNGLQMYRFNQ